MKNVKNLVSALLLVAMTAITLESAAATGSDAVVNINTATETELAYLPGIGMSKAKAIISHREKRPFKKVEDLMRVKGIGRQTFKKIQVHLSVDGPTTAKGKIKLTS